MRRRNGFTLIELLVVVAIIGILAVIAISNFYNAIHRSRQKRTMADMRTISVAWEARALDTRRYNAAGVAFTMPPNTLSYDDMTTMLIPTYVKAFPKNDAWGNPLEFGVDQPLSSASDAVNYAIRSPGRDNKYSTSYPTDGPTTDFDCDIVFSNGAFVIWPEGVQQK